MQKTTKDSVTKDSLLRRQTSMKIYILLMAASFTQTVSHGQTTFKYGPELGLAISHLPKSNLTDNGNTHKIMRESSPLYNPLIGVTTELAVKKYFQFTTGLQYQRTGERSYDHSYGYDYINNGNYSFETWETQIFHKICLPLTAGIKIKIWKLQPSLFIGYRLNYFLTGKYQRKSISHLANPTRDTSYVYEFDPFDRSALGWPIRKRLDSQLLYGFSVSIGQHLKISMTINPGRTFLYSESDISCLPYSFQNKDYILTAAYLFPTSKKKPDCPPTK